VNEPRCLVDSNILIRWVQPSDPDYSVVETALDALARRNVVLGYTRFSDVEALLPKDVSEDS
jgi:hypothetical protein